MIQVYGAFSGYWSHATVSRGMVAGLHRNGLQDIQIYNSQNFMQMIAGYEGLSEPIRDGGFNLPLCTGWHEAAPVGLFIGGYPGQIGERLDGHQLKVALLIAESATLPPAWGMVANRLDLVCVPSKWTAAAYIAGGVSPQKVLVVPHGLHPVYCQPGWRAPRPKRGKLRFLHIAGARDFIERKGTPQLIEAFKRTFDADQAMLRIRTPDHPQMRELCAGVHNIELDSANTPLSPIGMRELLLEGWHALVAPSRGEAFGMLPLEARALGLPVILTHCAGHLQHAHESDTVVPHGDDAVIRTNGILNGTAPQVTPAHVAVGLRDFVQQPLKLAPRSYHQKWTWKRTTAELAARLQQLIRSDRLDRRASLDDKTFG